MRKINEIIIHCSATDPANNVTVEDIRRWHIERGFKDIGYHYIIGLDGTIYEGRPVEQIGAHCKGHNRYSIGICYIGGVRDGVNCDTLTPAQETSMVYLIRKLCYYYSIPFSHVVGHNEYSNKDCPCFNVDVFRFLCF